MRNIIILGSTGALGQKSIEVLKDMSREYCVIGLVANKNKELLNKQKEALGLKTKQTILASVEGEEQVLKMVKDEKADVVINVISGMAGIAPTFAALEAGKILILGNKESVVAEGERISDYLNQIIPLDSEHNAIFEILKENKNKKIEKIIIPCSGGPFFGKNRAELENVTKEEVIAHPKWEMGEKISVESATLINKGIEIVEAHYLFKIPIKKIEAIIHPECEIHGMVKFKNGETIAYYGPPEMKEHVENTLLHVAGRSHKREIRQLDSRAKFYTPDHETFQGIEIVLTNFQNAPNKMKSFLQKEEKVINDFLKGKIKFLEIFTKLKN